MPQVASEREGVRSDRGFIPASDHPGEPLLTTKKEARTIYEGEHLQLRQREGWEFAERIKGKTAVIILPVTDDDRVVLIEQYRRPVDARVIEFPAGLVGDEEGNLDPAATAKKELEEETGYTCREIVRLTSGPTSTGITSERVTFFAAAGLEQRGAGGGVSDENIVVHRVPRTAVVDWLKRKSDEGILIEVNVWAGLWWLGIRAD